MKFDDFIQANLDAIVVEWEAFARTVLPAAKSMSDLALRDHSREILLAIVKDMRTGQTDSERLTKSRQVSAATETIAAAHGALRQAAGFDIAQVVSEFRALRSSVLALWVVKGRRPPSMPAGRYPTTMMQFGWMNAQDAAALLTYLRSSYGNEAPRVDAPSVAHALDTPP